ncbi:hypothetical protein GCM10009863_41780 [Streptomyces axinellae]|uniref:Uncharacterized protein n=1 Tax=Streptomyces axinellae TaxID=552788 RepID=A0ABP6CQ13_9ACTN
MPSQRPEGDKWTVPLVRHQRPEGQLDRPAPTMSRPGEEQTPARPVEGNSDGRRRRLGMATPAAELLAALAANGGNAQGGNAQRSNEGRDEAAREAAPDQGGSNARLLRAFPTPPLDGELALSMAALRLPSPVLGDQAHSNGSAPAATSGPQRTYRDPNRSPTRQGRGPGSGRG